ncbi:hypothetical protein ccbrp13_11180 [Ktedonobacteria bacterium brp13]|nr:hypothetical protein ccbrp13_11180 [Ktedonobacteria bacterium brp13]
MQQASKGATLQDAGDDVFEVFQQDLKRDNVPHHGGNLRAPDTELAVHYAREFYGRRQESDRLWIIPRTQLWEIQDTAYPVAHPLNEAYQQQARYPQPQPDQTTHESAVIFAVFGQQVAGKSMEWLYDLPAPLNLAEATQQLTIDRALSDMPYPARLWLCPRESIVELNNTDLLHPPLDRSYRRLDGYNIRDKLRTARQRTSSEHNQTAEGVEFTTEQQGGQPS